ncbi:MAG: hypothetical protein EOO88_42605 [Pedobacter sp.]|nr:MAG: hypothetical protein EOO88_42605 [Pedobacter sp.]
MTNLNELSTLFQHANSIKYKPGIKSLFLECPELNGEVFTRANTILKTIAVQYSLTLTLDFTSERSPSLIITANSETLTITKLRPIYSIKRKLEGSNPELVQLLPVQLQSPWHILWHQIPVNNRLTYQISVGF